MDQLKARLPDLPIEPALVEEFLEKVNAGLLPEDIPAGPPRSPKDRASDSVSERRGDDPRDKEDPIIYGEELDIEIKRPLVVVPGIMGSQIWERFPDGTIVQLWPPSIFDIRGSMARLGRLAPPQFAKNKIAPDYFPAIYGGLIAYLTAIGYELGVTLFPFPYDWTQSNKATGTLLHERIEQIKANTGADSVDVVCHSMGGLITRSAMLEGASVERVAYIASPHYGASKAFFALNPSVDFDFLESGSVVGFLEEALWRHVIRDDSDVPTLRGAIAILASKMPSVFELLPDAYYFETGEWVVSIQEFLLLGERYRDWGITYISGLSKFPDHYIPMVIAAMSFKSSLGRIPLPDDPNRRLIIAGRDHSTLDRVIYQNFRGLAAIAGGFETPYDSGQHGDGTVPTRSAESLTGPVTYVNDTHVSMPNNPDTWAALRNFLKT